MIEAAENFLSEMWVWVGSHKVDTVWAAGGVSKGKYLHQRVKRIISLQISPNPGFVGSYKLLSPGNQSVNSNLFSILGLVYVNINQSFRPIKDSPSQVNYLLK